MFQMVLYFVHNTLVLSFYIDVGLTLSIQMTSTYFEATLHSIQYGSHLKILHRRHVILLELWVEIRKSEKMNMYMSKLNIPF